MAERNVVNNWIYIAVYAAIIGGVFGLLWYYGQIKRLAAYCQETWVELQKCSWPTWEELKGSTVLIIVMIGLLSGSVLGIDAVLFKCMPSPFALAVVAVGGYLLWNHFLLKRQ